MIYLFETPQIAAQVALRFKGKYDGFNGVDFGSEWLNSRDELYYQVGLQFEAVLFYPENSFCWRPYPHASINDDSLVRLVVMDTNFNQNKEQFFEVSEQLETFGREQKQHFQRKSTPEEWSLRLSQLIDKYASNEVSLSDYAVSRESMYEDEDEVDY